MAFSVFDREYLFSQYYGKKIREADLLRLWQPAASGFTPNYDGAPSGRYALDTIPLEYPSYGGGDFREPLRHGAQSVGSRQGGTPFFS